MRTLVICPVSKDQWIYDQQALNTSMPGFSHCQWR
jgi:hypothetical protein